MARLQLGTAALNRSQLHHGMINISSGHAIYSTIKLATLRPGVWKVSVKIVLAFDKDVKKHGDVTYLPGYVERHMLDVGVPRLSLPSHSPSLNKTVALIIG